MGRGSLHIPGTTPLQPAVPSLSHRGRSPTGTAPFLFPSPPWCPPPSTPDPARRPGRGVPVSDPVSSGRIRSRRRTARPFNGPHRATLASPGPRGPRPMRGTVARACGHHGGAKSRGACMVSTPFKMLRAAESFRYQLKNIRRVAVSKRTLLETGRAGHVAQ